MYTGILRRLWDAIRRQRPQKVRIKIWFHFHDNTPSHRSVSIKGSLAKNNVTILEHPPFSPDQAAANCNLYHRLKSALKGRSFCDATEIIKNATEELKMLSQNCFQEYFQHFYSRWQKCIVARGDYFEGNLA